MEHQGRGNLLGPSASWICPCCSIHGLVDYYGVKKDYIGRKLWGLGGYRRKCFLIPTKALRDEGASYHYVAPSRYIEVDSRALTAIETVLKGKEIPYQEVMTWSTDGFYRETPDKVAYPD